MFYFKLLNHYFAWKGKKWKNVVFLPLNNDENAKKRCTKLHIDAYCSYLPKCFNLIVKYWPPRSFLCRSPDELFCSASVFVPHPKEKSRKKQYLNNIPFWKWFWLEEIHALHKKVVTPNLILTFYFSEVCSNPPT